RGRRRGTSRRSWPRAGPMRVSIPRPAAGTITQSRESFDLLPGGGMGLARIALLVPLADERLVELLPLPLEPHRRRRQPLLAQPLHRHDVVAPRRLPGPLIEERRAGNRLGGRAREGLVVEPPVQPVDAVTAQALLRVRGPFQLARRPPLPGEKRLRG